MRDFLEAVGWFAAYALGGRVGGEQIGVGGFEGRELVHERVVGGVGDDGRVFDVVEMLVMAQLVAQLGDSVRGVGTRHGPNYSEPTSRASSGCLFLSML